MAIRLSLTMIVKDEAATLGRCLSSVRDILDEIVVVDTGSTDCSKEIAASFGARVYDFIWRDDFAAARNEALRHTTGDWIFWLDADEYLDHANHQKMRHLVTCLKDDNIAFVMTQRSLSSDGASHVPQVRLFRKHPSARWEYRVHERPLPSLLRAGYEIRGTDIVITHTGYQDRTTYTHKMKRNLPLLLLDQSDHPDDPVILYNLGHAYFRLERFNEALSPLQNSLRLAPPADMIVPLIYATLIYVHRHLGQLSQALATCREARERFPDDPQLLYLDGQLHYVQGDLAGAELNYRQLLARFTDEKVKAPASSEHFTVISNPFTSVNADLALAALHELATLYQNQGRHKEAETLWRETFDQRPSLRDAWRRRKEFYLHQRRLNDWDSGTKEVINLPYGFAPELHANSAETRKHEPTEVRAYPDNP